ncbi:hypothetical protein MSI_21890 [Treponema sp. JC4]|uniref:hypothetical protein n=1 Tax=Treponema sp. JC4 TaxID=1124982 RepID=UPI00025AFDA6|nr:hypothetical protein [Treponema sp. JC4]EID84356.1 hypothetical protein MSI_21890 [Treponema sp. JC4]
MRNTFKDIVNKDNIDDMYFSFINRFLLADIVAQSEDTQDKISKEFADKKFNTLFSKLYNKELEYYGFDLYEEKLDICNALSNLEKCLDSISKNLTNLGKVQNCCYPRWEDLIVPTSNESEDDGENLEEDISKDVKFEFIPRKIKNETGTYEVSTLKIHTRIAFYAICLYFIQDSSFNETNFKEWMQFVWNIIENVKAHQSVEVMISQDKLLYKIYHESHRIMSWLCELDENNLPQVFNFVSDQMKEEIEKAKQKKNTEFIQKINKAENYAFFHGAIRFLFHDEQNNLDWNNFDKRFENAKRYFNNDGTKINKYELLKKYISFFDNWNFHFESNFIFDSEKKTWRDNLLNINRRKPTELLLMGYNKRSESSFEDPYQRYVHNYLLNTDALITLGENIPGSTIKYKWWWGNSYVVHPYNCKAEWKIYYIHYRNELLTNIKGIAFVDENQEKWRKNGLCWNKNIYFRYKEHNFLWDEQNKIYLLKDDFSKTRKSHIEPDEPWVGAEHPRKFLEKLQELIDKQ